MLETLSTYVEFFLPEAQLYITKDTSAALNLANLVLFYLSTPSELGDVTARGGVPNSSELRNMAARTLPTYPLRIRVGQSHHHTHIIKRVVQFWLQISVPTK
jgi:hypothetical protein